MHKYRGKEAREDFRKVEFLISRDGAVMRAFSSHQCVPGSIPAKSHIRVEFVAGSRLAPRVFLCVQVLRFFSFHKNKHLQIPIPAEGDVGSFLNIVIYLSIWLV